MDWLQSIDNAGFHFINGSLSNHWCDAVAPSLSWNSYFMPTVLLLCTLLLWRGGTRGRLFVLMLALALMLGEGLLIEPLKQAVGRPRPFMTLTELNLLAGKSSIYRSMPSGHSSIWFAAAMVSFIFYRKSWRFMLPIACLIAVSRVYLGVHYPSDVVAGAILGAGYAVAVLWLAQAFWQTAGAKIFPIWQAQLPVLVPLKGEPLVFHPAPAGIDPREDDRQWLWLGYAFTIVMLLFRFWYLASGIIDLSKDEAYQWVWSKNLALSYFSKPPMIALIQFAGTSIWGDSAFGVRFFSPVFAALLSWVMLRFMAQVSTARLGFLMLLMVSAAPMMSAGAILMTIDPPLVLCWVVAMVAGWRAVQSDGATRHWLLVGLFMALGFLSKYAQAFQIICWVLFFVLYAPARMHLRKPGPYLALLINLLATIPVIIWNSQHDWITVSHVASNAGVNEKWVPTLRNFWDFVGAQLGLLNPVFLVAALWAMVAFWPRRRERPLWLYLCCMGAPVFMGYWLFTFYNHVMPNWIAPAVVPMFTLAALFWYERYREGQTSVRHFYNAGLIFGLVVVVIAHDTNFIGRLRGWPLPPERDPTRRTRAWPETAAAVNAARKKLESEGRPTFVIADHYGMTGELSMYIPEARAAAATKMPLVYSVIYYPPRDQFYFIPKYRYEKFRRGHSAIYVTEYDQHPLVHDWFQRWWRGDIMNLKAARDATPPMMIPLIGDQFESVKDLGMVEVQKDGRTFSRLRLFECRNLR